MYPIKVFMIAISFSMLPSNLLAEQDIPTDLLPMYGGMGRASTEEIKKGHDEFIEKVTEEFGTRENAAKAFVERAFQFYHKNDLSAAMRRFNQAWLIDPQNPGAFWGFASVQYDIGANCSAMRMTEHALRLGFSNPEFLADAGMMHALCPVGADNFSNEQKNTYLEKSSELFEKAISIASTNPYIYDKWGQSLYWRDDYIGAWDKVFLTRKYGGDPHPQFLDALKEKMAEPSS